MYKDIVNEYFEWMYDRVCGDRRTSYRRLLSHLHNIEFTYILPMDGNRAEDGIDLRYRFGYENDIPDSVIAACLDVEPCSVLEMMVALAIRCEEHIMSDPDIGDRAGQWFWTMLTNLGLAYMNDFKCDEDEVDIVISNLLHREYKRDGSNGGLFRFVNCDRDLRNVEIWYQAMWYLDDVLKI